MSNRKKVISIIGILIYIGVILFSLTNKISQELKEYSPEIAENNEITRQAVRDIIKKSEKKLFELEEELSFMKKQAKQEKTVNSILEKLMKLEEQEAKQENKKILEKAKEELKTLI